MLCTHGCGSVTKHIYIYLYKNSNFSTLKYSFVCEYYIYFSFHMHTVPLFFHFLIVYILMCLYLYLYLYYDKYIFREIPYTYIIYEQKYLLYAYTKYSYINMHTLKIIWVCLTPAHCLLFVGGNYYNTIETGCARAKYNRNICMYVLTVGLYVFMRHSTIKSEFVKWMYCHHIY